MTGEASAIVHGLEYVAENLQYLRGAGLGSPVVVNVDQRVGVQVAEGVRIFRGEPALMLTLIQVDERLKPMGVSLQLTWK